MDKVHAFLHLLSVVSVWCSLPPPLSSVSQSSPLCVSPSLSRLLQWLSPLSLQPGCARLSHSQVSCVLVLTPQVDFRKTHIYSTENLLYTRPVLIILFLLGWTEWFYWKKHKTHRFLLEWDSKTVLLSWFLPPIKYAYPVRHWWKSTADPSSTYQNT